MRKTEKYSEQLAAEMARFYDEAVLKNIKGGANLFYAGKFRNKRVPKYLRIKIPIIERHYCCSECGCSESGWLIRTKEIKLFRIGTEVIKLPVMRKFKGQKIKFKRYRKLK